jgi:D-tyrosyl-tRNA(Tyr) deacylase
MRAVIQRVKSAEVDVDGRLTGKIGKGLLVLVGVGKGDGEVDISYMASKVPDLRIFEDSSGKFTLSLRDVKGEMLIVSQFTLYADCRKGRRPSFDHAAAAEHAQALYNYFVESAKRGPVRVQTGVFQAEMEVHLVNQGPVTIIIDSADRNRS